MVRDNTAYRENINAKGPQQKEETHIRGTRRKLERLEQTARRIAV